LFRYRVTLKRSAGSSSTKLASRGAPHVDHVTDDLMGFLTGIAALR
jgi:hypothetical protein